MHSKVLLLHLIALPGRGAPRSSRGGPSGSALQPSAPQDRQRINQTITSEINDLLGLDLTDAFCGFKAYRREALARLHITETGWGMPLQLWVQAARLGLGIKEVGVPRVYLDRSRAFGGALNDATERLAYYRRVIEVAEQEVIPNERRRSACRLTLGTFQQTLNDKQHCEETCW